MYGRGIVLVEIGEVVLGSAISSQYFRQLCVCVGFVGEEILLLHVAGHLDGVLRLFFRLWSSFGGCWVSAESCRVF